MGRQESRNHTRTVWALKCDIRKFFASIDHEILLAVLERKIADDAVLRLLREVITSTSGGSLGVGLPLGNLTSQLFANVYLNELDQFMKHRLRVRSYIRYADDFVLLSPDRSSLLDTVPIIRDFLIRELRLDVHPDKLFLRTMASGVDFLGWVHFPDHRVMRKASRERMLRNIRHGAGESALASYLGLLVHGNAERLRRTVVQEHWCWGRR